MAITTPSQARTIGLPGATIPLDYTLLFPAKEPAAVIDYALDIQPWLDDGQGILNPAVTVTANPADLIVSGINVFIDAELHANVGFTLAGGTPGFVYSLQFTAGDSEGRTFVATGWIQVRSTSAYGDALPPLIVGASGSPGTRGASLLVGSGAPGSGLGNAGDTYLDTASGQAWTKGAGGWTTTANSLVTLTYFAAQATTIADAAAANARPPLPTLEQITDVTISAPQEGDSLVFHNNKWINSGSYSGQITLDGGFA